MADREHNVILNLVLQTKNLQREVKKIHSELNKNIPNMQLGVDPKAHRNLNRLNTSLKTTSKQAKSAEKGMYGLGEATALASKRLLAYVAAAAPIYSIGRAIGEAADEAVKFEYELVRIAQVQKRTLAGMSGLEREISKLSTGIGAVSADLVQVSRLLAQSGLSARDTQTALVSLAKTSLTPSFNDIVKTTEGAIAIMNQFGTSANQLEAQLGSINALAKKFAVESEDIITVIRKAGGVFSTTGGTLDELISLFTAVRSTTRESAETIGTGFRTIFARLQRTRTVNLLRKFGIETAGLDPYERIRAIAEGVERLRDAAGGNIAIAKIREEIGGLRQIAKAIPLLEQFDKAQRALNVARGGQASLEEDVQRAQQATIVQMRKVKEEFLELARAILADDSMKFLIKSTLQLTSNLVKLVDALRPAIPLLLTLGSVKLGMFAYGFAKKLPSKLGSRDLNIGIQGTGYAAGGKVPSLLTPGEVVFTPEQVRKVGVANLKKMNTFATGGTVPGSGNKDNVYANLEPGSFVLRKRSVKALGLGKYGSGGRVKLAVGDFIDGNYEQEYAQYREELADEARKQAKIEREVTLSYKRREADLRRRQTQRENQAFAQVRKGTATDSVTSSYQARGDQYDRPIGPQPNIIYLPDGPVPQTPKPTRGVEQYDQPIGPKMRNVLPANFGQNIGLGGGVIHLPGETRETEIDPYTGAPRPKGKSHLKRHATKVISQQTTAITQGVKTQEEFNRVLDDASKRQKVANQKTSLLSKTRDRLSKVKPQLDLGLGLGANRQTAQRDRFKGLRRAGMGLQRGALPAALLLPSLLPQDPKTAGAASISAGVQSGFGAGALVAQVNPIAGVITGVVTGLDAARQAAEDFAKNTAFDELTAASNKYADLLKEVSNNTEEFNTKLAEASQKLATEISQSFDLIVDQSQNRGIQETLGTYFSTLGQILGQYGNMIEDILPDKAGGGAGGMERLFTELNLPLKFTPGLKDIYDDIRAQSVASEISEGAQRQQDAVSGAGAALRNQIKAGRITELTTEQKSVLGLEQASGKQLQEFGKQFVHRQRQGYSDEQLDEFQISFFADIAEDTAKELTDLGKKIRQQKELYSQANNNLNAFASNLNNIASSIRLAQESVSGFDDRLSVMAGNRGGFKASTANLTTLQNFRTADPRQYRQAVRATAGTGVANAVGIQQQIAKVLPNLIEQTKASGQPAIDEIIEALDKRFRGVAGAKPVIDAVRIGLMDNVSKFTGNIGKGGVESISSRSMENFSFLQEGLVKIEQERIKVEQDFIDNLEKLGSIEDRLIQSRLQNVGITYEAESGLQEFRQRQGLSDFGSLSNRRASSLFARQQALTAFNANTPEYRRVATDPRLLTQAIIEKRAELQSDIDRGDQPQATRTAKELERLETALKGLRDSTLVLTEAQKRLGELEKQQQGAFSFFDRYITGSPREQAELRRTKRDTETLAAGGQVSGRRRGSAYQLGQEFDAAGLMEFSQVERRMRDQAAQDLGFGNEFRRINSQVFQQQGTVNQIQDIRLQAGRNITGLAQQDVKGAKQTLEDRQRTLNEQFQKTLADSTKFINSLNDSSKNFRSAAESIPKKIDLTTTEPIRVIVHGDQALNNIDSRIKELINEALDRNNSSRDTTRPPAQQAPLPGTV